MKWNKEICEELAASKALILINDGWQEDGMPILVIRKAIKAYGSKSGRDSHWGVLLDEPLSCDCTGVAFSHVLAYKINDNVTINSLLSWANSYPLADEKVVNKIVADGILMINNADANKRAMLAADVNDNLNAILNICAKEFGTTVEEMKGRGQQSNVVMARQAFCWLGVVRVRQTLGLVGSFINRHHSTVAHSRRQVDDYIETKYRPFILHFNSIPV